MPSAQPSNRSAQWLPTGQRHSFWETSFLALGLSATYGAITTGALVLIGMGFLWYSWGWPMICAAAPMGILVGSVLLLVIPIDLSARKNLMDNDSDDFAYHPRLSHARLWLQSPQTRWTLILGLLPILFHNATLFSAQFVPTRFLPESNWPEIQILLSLFCFYDLLWITDCLVRPGRGTIIAAAGFTLVFWLLLFSADGFNSVRV